MGAAINKKPFEEAVALMSMATSEYYHEYVFYLHLLAQCRVQYDETIPAAAGVSFHRDHYVLSLNPLESFETASGTPVQGFSKAMPVAHRIGILKHEMLHIAYNHLERFIKHTDINVHIRENIDSNALYEFKLFNYASDCALNQDITRSHLPAYAIYPDNYPAPSAANHPKQTAEFYYDLFKKHVKKQQKDKDGDESGGKGKGKKGKPQAGDGDEFGNGTMPVDDHGKWLESEGDEIIHKEITKRMVERAARETVKAKGTLPADYDKMIDNLTIRREVDWKQKLRRICGNKKANRRKVITRKDRRMPHANWLKGTTKHRTFELGVISDASGSVNDAALIESWGEIISICKSFDIPVNMVQVDTVPTEPEKLTKACRAIARKRTGGTFLSPAIEKFKEHGIRVDALVVTTDGYLFDGDIEPFAKLGIPIIWLIESNGQIMDDMNKGLMTAIKLSKDYKGK